MAVLGGGPMGLAVAYQLVKDGHHPVLFEAGPRIGGMTTTFDFEGTTIERFYHFHCTSDVDFFELLDELGLGDRMRWTRTRMGLWYQGRVQRWGDPIALLRFRGLSLLGKIRYGLHAFTSVKRNNWRKLDGLEAQGWVKWWIGQKAYDVTWRKLFDLKFYDYADQLSAAWIWSRIRRIGRSRSSLLAEKLGALEGGSDTWLTAIEDAITRGGGEIRLRTPIEEVVIDDNKVRGVRTPSGMEEFDHVISTVPLPYVSEMMPGLPEDVLTKYRAQKNIAVVCVIAKLRRQLTEYFWLNVNRSTCRPRTRSSRIPTRSSARRSCPTSSGSIRTSATMTSLPFGQAATDSPSQYVVRTSSTLCHHGTSRSKGCLPRTRRITTPRTAASPKASDSAG
jgi:protoporphyrinogen oxidase